MECPFELPVKIVDYNDSYTRAPLKNKGIVTSDNITLVKLIWPSYADYIVKAINSYEKLMKAIETFPDVHMCTCNCEVCLWFRTKVRPVQQVLKEVEKA